MSIAALIFVGSGVLIGCMIAFGQRVFRIQVPDWALIGLVVIWLVAAVFYVTRAVD